MNVSLVLCSKNGGNRLKTCLSYIAAIETSYLFDVVLVDNNSSDNSINLMKAFSNTARYESQAIEEKRPGNSAGRNAGIARARGELILFIDDDCYPSPDFVDQWVRVFEDPSVGFGSGMVAPFKPEQSMLGCRTTPVIEWVQADAAVRRGLIQGSNMAFRRACLTAAGLFDPRFGAGTRFAGEDWDLAVRVSRAGWKGGYFPGPGVSHDHGRGDADASARERYYDFGGGAVYMKSFLRRLDREMFWHLREEFSRFTWRRRLWMTAGAFAFLLPTAGRA